MEIRNKYGHVLLIHPARVYVVLVVGSCIHVFIYTFGSLSGQNEAAVTERDRIPGSRQRNDQSDERTRVLVGKKHPKS